ncbi:hypothetical protein KP77_28890 [Jeotgalibacillus alimentarius]|uniref:Uncharacterized protein n=1 Tax=Jeotgalibacillus alimentarius TaxID=135826 RepID=A0A0C2VL02_9BACL|nr:hypothetical protein [Jeotgalibacillus alimentarius]KIL44668.1 hypothetical protein KP77_28890 [Jeotgalibacillus alimentarius]
MQKEILFDLNEQRFFIQSMQPSNVRHVSLTGHLPGSRIGQSTDLKKLKPLQ